MGEASQATAAAPTDGVLVERAAGGDPRAFEALVLKYQDRVYNLALRLTRRPEEAEDVTQDAFIKAHGALAGFGGRSAFYTWLFRITFNAAQSRLRSLGRLRAHETPSPIGDSDPDGDGRSGVGEPVSDDPGPASAVEREDSAARVREAVDALEPENRAVVVLREIEGLSYDEIAEVTGSTRGAVKSRLHRARAELAVALKDLVQ